MFLLLLLLPNSSLTPGVARPLTVRQVCAIAWDKDARHVSEAMRAQVYRRYGAKKGKNCCEVDHLISRELGGADDIKNLWPQPWNEARIKDRIENWLHRQVCAGKMKLQDAQKGIAKDWRRYIQ